MTRETAKQKLIELGVAEPTEEQITALLNSISDETRAEKTKAEQLKAEAEKAKQLQEELDVLKSQGLSESEKTAKLLEDIQKENAELKKSTVLSEVKAILNKSGIDEDSYKDIIDGFVSDDIEVSKQRANAFVSVISKQKESAIAQTKKDLLDKTKKPGEDGSGGNNDPEKSDAEKIAESLGKKSAKANEAAKTVLDNYL